ncbi:uncharacterized protein BDW43DRAFT_292153 [Aspergillus alliaceus]|uniref:uncharacterized protein n=1 Tax=Petromyces alliaceus TaxID=209559 RepID=UPI0012A6E89D|nr:uncharacterized protein BDW43DRAFT_292153 [Aspergillus alliaceus]KAB8228084.1 hypothetical protein BDW43DRAFT_292153 [Aspergillus alliaceus]
MGLNVSGDRAAPFATHLCKARLHRFFFYNYICVAVGGVGRKIFCLGVLKCLKSTPYRRKTYEMRPWLWPLEARSLKIGTVLTNVFVFLG